MLSQRVRSIRPEIRGGDESNVIAAFFPGNSKCKPRIGDRNNQNTVWHARPHGSAIHTVKFAAIEF